MGRARRVVRKSNGERPLGILGTQRRGQVDSLKILSRITEPPMGVHAYTVESRRCSKLALAFIRS